MAAQAGEVGVAPAVEEVDPTTGLAGWMEGLWHRLRLDVTLPAAVLLLVVGACFLWPLVYHVPPPLDAPNPVPKLPPFSPGHIFGTDAVGNDVLSQILYGGRVSLEVGVSVGALGFLVGGGLGMLAGYAGGLVDAVVMRILDAFIAFPSLVLALAIAEGLGASEMHVIWALAFFSVPAFGRIARASALQVREQPYVTAGRLSGDRRLMIVLEHIAPNVLPTLLTFAMLNIGVAIVIEGALDFLGLGIPPPTPSWGNMIAAGQQYISTDPGLLLIPSAFLVLTVLAFNRLGDALRARWGT